MASDKRSPIRLLAWMRRCKPQPDGRFILNTQPGSARDELPVFVSSWGYADYRDDPDECCRDILHAAQDYANDAGVRCSFLVKYTHPDQDADDEPVAHRLRLTPREGETNPGDVASLLEAQMRQNEKLYEQLLQQQRQMGDGWKALTTTLASRVRALEANYLDVLDRERAAVVAEAEAAADDSSNERKTMVALKVMQLLEVAAQHMGGDSEEMQTLRKLLGHPMVKQLVASTDQAPANENGKANDNDPNNA